MQQLIYLYGLWYSLYFLFPLYIVNLTKSAILCDIPNLSYANRPFILGN